MVTVTSHNSQVFAEILYQFAEAGEYCTLHCGLDLD